MALDTYSGLVESIGAWLGKGATLDARIPDMIRLAETDLNEQLDDPEMEVSDTLTLVSGSAALPADFGSLISASSTLYGRIEQVSASQFSDFRPLSGNPRSFAIIDNAFTTAPSGTGAVSIVYRRRIPALTAAAPSNWLLTRSPNAYLYGCLLQAEFFGWNDERLPTIQAFYERAVSGLRQDALRRKWGGAPLAPRLGRT